MKTTRTIDNPPVARAPARAAPRLHDFVLILLAGLFLLALITLDALLPLASDGELASILAALIAILRVPLGLLYVLFVPGYLLQAFLFPRRHALDGIERLGLSLGLSIALVLLVALLLDRLPWGLRFWPIVIGQLLLILLLLLAALLRRVSLPPAQAYAPNLQVRLAGWWHTLQPTDRRLYLFAGGALLLAALAAAWVFLVPSGADYFTEFYMLGKDGMAEDYPRAARAAETLTVTLGLTNHERDPQTYRVEIWQRDPFSGSSQLLERTTPFVLEVDGTRTWSQPWQPQWAGDDQQIEFLLFTPHSTDPYRRLLLWIDVAP